MNIVHRLTLLLSLLTLASCTSIKSMDSKTTIHGKSIQNTVIVVPKPFNFESTLESGTLPAGRYIPEGEDREGIFYKTPKPIQMEGLVDSLWGGGLYVKKSDPKQICVYLRGSGDEPMRFELPKNFPHSFESPTAEEKTIIKSIDHVRTETEDGKYDKELSRKIQSHWFELVDERNPRIDGSVNIEFELCSDGTIRNPRVAECTKNLSPDLLDLCVRAVKECAPFPSFPAKMKSTCGQSRVINIVFQYRLDISRPK